MVWKQCSAKSRTALKRKEEEQGRGKKENKRRNREKTCDCILAISNSWISTLGIILTICQATFWPRPWNNQLLAPWQPIVSGCVSSLRESVNWATPCQRGMGGKWQLWNLSAVSFSGCKFIFISSYANSPRNEAMRRGTNLINLAVLCSPVSSHSLWSFQSSILSICLFVLLATHDNARS